jgi:hypothetical protein
MGIGLVYLDTLLHFCSESAMGGVERMFLVSEAARTALPTPALIPEKIRGFTKLAELRLQTNLRPPLPGKLEVSSCFIRISEC